jgi:dihydrofolate reductase
VVSTTLPSVEWRNSTLITGDVAEQLNRLKQQPSKNISVTGSATLVRWLLGEGLLDELRLLLYPLVVGTGRRLFEDGSDEVALRLLDSKPFSTGVVSLTYEPAGSYPRRNLDSGLAGGRLSRSGMVRISSYFRSL